MTINNEKKDDVLTCHIKGSINTQTAPDFEKEVNKDIENVTKLIIDLKEVDYVSSAGLRVLLTLENLMEENGEMKVINVSPNVKEVFDMTGFSSILTLE
jgi:anti-sigma B factor antagonist